MPQVFRALYFVLVFPLLNAGGGAAFGQVTSLPFRLFDSPLTVMAGQVLGNLSVEWLDPGADVLLFSPEGLLGMGSARLRGETLTLQQPIRLQYAGADIFAAQAKLDQGGRQGSARNLYVRTPEGHASLRELTFDATDNLNAANLLYASCVACPYKKTPWMAFVQYLTLTPDDAQVRARNVQISIFDVPMLSIPYWQFADPRLDRLTGYLQPELRSSEYGGTSLTADRFWNLGPTRDVTAGITLHRQGGLGGQMRYRFADPRSQLSAQLRLVLLDQGGEAFERLATPERALADIEVTFDHFLSPRWRVRGQGRFESNDEFGLRFGHDDSTIRPSYAEAEYFHGETYGQVRLSRDWLTPDAATDSEPPLRLQAFHTVKLRPFVNQGAFVKLSQDAELAHRKEGHQNVLLASTVRFSSGVQSLGAPEVQIGGFARQTLSSRDSVEADFTSYGLDLDWSLPLQTASRISLRPQVRLSWAGGSPPDGKLANEKDFRLPFLSAATLFRPLDSGPVDRGFSGQRLDLGLEAQHRASAWSLAGFAGLRYQDGIPTYAPSFSGDKNGTSAGLLQLEADHWETGLNLSYLGRLPRESNDPVSHDLSLQLPIKEWRVAVAYAQETIGADVAEGEAWTLNLQGPLTDKWRAEFSLSEDLRTQSETIYGLNLGYEDCCLGFNFYVNVDEENGTANRTWGINLDLIGLTRSGGRDALSP